MTAKKYWRALVESTRDLPERTQPNLNVRGRIIPLQRSEDHAYYNTDYVE